MQRMQPGAQLHLQGDRSARQPRVFPRSGLNQPRVPTLRITPVPFHCLAYTCWVCEDTDEFYKPRICVCRRYIRDSASVPVEKAIQRDWPPSRNRRRRRSEPEMPQSFEETRPRLPRQYDRVNLIESADIKSCPGCNNGARQSICRGMSMRMSEEGEWPLPGACDLWECSNLDCDYWGGGTGSRRECRCLGVLGDLCIAHGCNETLNGHDGYITSTQFSMPGHPRWDNPITYGFVLYGDIMETEHRLRRSQLALHLIDGNPFPDGVYRPPSNSGGMCKPDVTLPRFSEDDYDPGGGGPGGAGDSGRTNLDPNCRAGEITSLNPIAWRGEGGNEPSSRASRATTTTSTSCRASLVRRPSEARGSQQPSGDLAARRHESSDAGASRATAPVR